MSYRGGVSVTTKRDKTDDPRAAQRRKPKLTKEKLKDLAPEGQDVRGGAAGHEFDKCTAKISGCN